MSLGRSKLSDWLLHEGSEDPAVQRLLLRTLLDDKGTSVLCLFWTQFCWFCLCLATGPSRAAVICLVADLFLFAVRWRQRELYRDADGNTLRRSSRAILASILGTAFLLSVAVAWLLVCGPTYALVLGSVVAPGLAGFYACLYGAFPRLSVLTFGALDAALTIGLALNPDWRVALLAIGMPGGGILYYFLIMRTRRSLVGSMRAQHDNWVRSLRDTLTGLGNRDCLDRALDGRCVEGHPAFALMIVDLDGFKPVNDRLGHAAGDEVLRTVARMLRASLGHDDLVCRTGGDEFALLLADADEFTIHALGKRIIASIETPIDVAGSEVLIGASVGVAIFPDHARSAGGLMECADAAMYLAKRDGKGRLVVA